MDFLKATIDDYWFTKHPEKVAGVEITTSSLFFPIQIKGSKEDVLRVTAMRHGMPSNKKNTKVLSASKKIQLAKARARSIQIQLQLQ